MSEELPRSVANSHLSMPGWSVEAKYRDDRPKQIGAYLLGEKWQTIDFQRSTCGVPNGSQFSSRELDEEHLLSYPAAQALRWWLHAIAHHEGSDWLLETRLVRHEIKRQKDCTAIAYEETLTFKAFP